MLRRNFLYNLAIDPVAIEFSSEDFSEKKFWKFII